jgi:hypothetical protein
MLAGAEDTGWREGGPLVAGLRLEALYGGFAGEPLDDNSPEYVFVARR